MKLILIVIIILFLSCEKSKLPSTVESPGETPPLSASQSPASPGEMLPLLPEFYIIGSKILVYPENARRNNIEGVVRIDFWILNGKSTSTIISQGSGNAELDSAAIKYARLLSFKNTDSLLQLSVPFEFKLVH